MTADIPDVDLGLSAEVEYYLTSRGFGLPTAPPLIATPEPSGVAGAVFDPDRVDRVIAVMRALRHTQGPLAGQPLEPDPWQVAYLLAPVFGWVRPDSRGGYVRIIREVWAELPRKNGKGEYVGEMILTGGGWKKFGDLRVGDLVHAEDGTLVPVTYTSPVHELDCYRVSFADGQSTICDADHLWTVFDRYGHGGRDHSIIDRRVYLKGAWRTLSTPEIAETFNISRPGATNTVGGKAYPKREYRYAVRTDRVLDRPRADLPLDPYLLGVWLGDGSTDAAVITTPDPVILESFRAAGFQTPQRPLRPGNGAQQYGIKPGFLTTLRALGVLGNKHVPERYLLASAEQRMDLLRGLMDTDGGVILGPSAKTPRVEFSSTRRGLAEAVLFLARSLGWKATLGERRPRLNARNVRRYRVAWMATQDRPPFRLARHIARLRDQSPAAAARSRSNKIVAVERVPTVPTMCIQVDHPSHQFLVGEGLIPTHNTTIAGATAIYLTAADGEAGAQVIAAATTKDQAGFCFRPIKQLAEQSPLLRKHVKAYQSKIVHRKSGSTFQAISAIADAQHGANIAGAIIDEVHLHKDAELVEAIETGTGSRSQPLIFMITTADDGRPNTIYARKRRRIEQLADGALHDPTTYGVIWAAARSEADLTDDPFSADTLRRANPGYGVSPTAEYLERAAQKAKENAAELGTYLRLHLGVRTRQTARFIPLGLWDASAGMVDETRLDGRDCWGGLDLSSVEDLTALVWLFPDRDGDRYEALFRFWLPEDRLPNLSRRTAGAADAWVRRGFLKLTPGNVIDNEAVLHTVDADARRFRVQTMGYDRWGATDVVRRLGEQEMTCVGVGQGYASLNAPTKELLRLVLLRKLVHGGNPVMRWMIDNLSVLYDPQGQVKPDKANAADKIDGVSATITALSEAMASMAEVDILDAVF
jgi:phage terminase large subunit-like protein